MSITFNPKLYSYTCWSEDIGIKRSKEIIKDVTEQRAAERYAELHTHVDEDLIASGPGVICVCLSDDKFWNKNRQRFKNNYDVEVRLNILVERMGE